MKYLRKTKKLMPLMIGIILLFLSVSITLADPTINVNPSQPKPLGTVSFSATIPDVEDIQKVTIRVQECGNEPNIGYICYTDEFNKTMVKSADGTYGASITLNHENAIEIKYQLKYQTSQGWISYPSDDLVTVDLDTSDQTNGDSNGGNGDSSSDSPGFEFLALFISVIFITLILYKRKR